MSGSEGGGPETDGGNAARRRPPTLHLPLDKEGRDLFFQVISTRSETASVILTTNKAFKDWGEVFQDNAVATAIAERLIENGELIKIEGSSYRVKRKKFKGSDAAGLGE